MTLSAWTADAARRAREHATELIPVLVARLARTRAAPLLLAGLVLAYWVPPVVQAAARAAREGLRRC